MSDPVIDAATFAELQDSAGAEFTAELVGTFLEEAPGMLAELRDALAGAQAERFTRMAHSLKSNAHTFGALELAAQARALELAGLNTDAAKDAAALDALDAAYAAAAAELKVLSHG